MDLVLCHTTADFDTLGAAVAITLAHPGSRIVLAGGAHPTVQRFLALHRDEYALLDRRAVNFDHVRSLTVVDTQFRERLGPLKDWIALAISRQIPITLYDHHLVEGDIPSQQRVVEPVGAATTLVVEKLRLKGLQPSIAEATVMALGIHVDTGSLVFEQTTVRDGEALVWLMARGVSQRAVAEFVEPQLSPILQELLAQAMTELRCERWQGYALGRVELALEGFVPGLSSLTEQLMSSTDCDLLLLAAGYPHRQAETKLVVIARARSRLVKITNGFHLGELLQPLGGGGHATAAAATLNTPRPREILEQLWEQLRSQLPHPPLARDLMSSPVRTIRPSTTVHEAQRVLLRYGHSGLSVVNSDDQLVGVISRRDIDLALHHGFGHAPVKGYMATDLKTIKPQTSLPDIETLMVAYDIGRLPVLQENQLIGIVTRTDVLRQLHQDQMDRPPEGVRALPAGGPNVDAEYLRPLFQRAFGPHLWSILQQMGAVTQARGWHLYLVGGAVRDVLRAQTPAAIAELNLKDIDLVVDGYYQSAAAGAGVTLAQAIKQQHPEVELQTYGRFQTAALVWHRDLDSELAGLMIDIATARTEFYPYPAANPEVEASSIRQDLYRRDFTINALALRLTNPGAGSLLDFFGGLMDLRQGVVRVLHANSFIEDPTRIYRAVRFAVRLGFAIDPQTEGYIHHALETGIYTQMQRQAARVPGLQTRLKNELRYILEAPYWQSALGQLDRLGALRCLHDDLHLSDRLWRQLRRMTRWLHRFELARQLPPWLMRLEVLLSELPPADRGPAAMALQLPIDSQQRLANLAKQEANLLAEFTKALLPSQVVHILETLDQGALLLLSARHPRPLGQIIWRYLTCWASVPMLLNGKDLKRLGYPPGPRYRLLLETLRAATLDGVITTSAEAEAFLSLHFPLN